jgi:hypothetical protein
MLRSRMLRGGLVATILAAAVVAAPAATPTAEAAGAPITGTVFLDENFNGIQDATETSLVDTSGLTLVAEDVAGATATAVFTGNTYAINVSGLTGTSFRLRLEASLSSVVYPGAADLSAGQTSVDYTTSGSVVDFAVTDGPVVTCPDNPWLATVCMNGGDLSNATIAGRKSIFRTDWLGSTTVVTGQTSATGSQWGLAYAQATDQMFTSAYLRRYAAMGPGGPGAIYASPNYSTATPGAPSLFVTIPNVGTVPSNASRQLATTVNGASHDPDVFGLVGKAGIGDIDVNELGTVLYVTNLFTRDVVMVSTSTKAILGTLGLPAVTANQCAGTGVARPFALKGKGQDLFVGVVCDASTTGNNDDLNFQVYKYSNGSWSTAFSTTQRLNTFIRGASYSFNNMGRDTWHAWSDSVTFQVSHATNPDINSDRTFFAYSQPILSDIEFTDTGNMVLGFMDRGMTQWGSNDYGPDPARTDTALFEYSPDGDIYAAGLNADGTFTLENRGVITGVNSGTLTGNTTNGQGPGGGEFFSGDFINSGGEAHWETSLAGLAIKPGSGQVAMTAVDPINFVSQGISWLSQTNGTKERGYEVSRTTGASLFGKAQSLGDLEIVCRASGTVQVGNFTWLDANRNGIQDVGELPMPGVVVTVYADNGSGAPSGPPLGTATTNAAGEWLVGGLAATTKYVAVFNASGVDPTSVGLPAGTPLELTTPLQGTDSLIDSNPAGTLASAIAPFTTGPIETVNHSIDAGYIPVLASVSVGDYVWIDTNGDGVQDGTDVPVAGATMTLTGPDGAAVTDVFGNPVGPVETDADGKYLFANLPVLPAGQSYTVSIDASTAPALEGYVPTKTGAGTTATDSSTGSASSTADLSTNGASDLTLDFGFVPASVSVGDYVWIDTNGDGVQDGTDVPVAGATMTLTGPDGAAVTDVFGNPVGPVETDADGKYLFANLPVLPAGQSYTVSIDASTAPALEGYVPTKTGAGTTATDSSTGSASSTADLSTNGASDLTLDFGFVPASVSVGDYVWIDTNGDGVQDGTDVPVAGATMTLTGPDGAAVTDVFGNPVGPVETDADGKYLFANLPVLPAGQSYTVSIDASTAPALEGYVPTKTGAGTTATDSSTGSASSTADLSTNGASDLTLDFGFVPASVSVGDYVWIDTNGDGVQDGTDVPVAGATMTLTGPDGAAVTDVFGNPVGPVETDADGKYLFANLPVLPAGQSYTVSIDASTAPALEGYVPTKTGAGTTATDSSTGSASSTADLSTNGASDLTLDFGFVPASVSVGDYVWIDTNGDGVQDGTDVPVAGATMTLTGPDGAAVTDVFGNPVGPVETDADGKYLFANLPVLPAGQSYTVSIDASTAPALEGYVPTKTGAGTTATDSSTGSASSTADLSTNGASGPDVGLRFRQARVGG